MGIALDIQIALGSIAILTVLILPINEHGMSFCPYFSVIYNFNFIGLQLFSFNLF
jgi:hypothetical protein